MRRGTVGRGEGLSGDEERDCRARRGTVGQVERLSGDERDSRATRGTVGRGEGLSGEEHRLFQTPVSQSS